MARSTPHAVNGPRWTRLGDLPRRETRERVAPGPGLCMYVRRSAENESGSLRKKKGNSREVRQLHRGKILDDGTGAKGGSGRTPAGRCFRTADRTSGGSVAPPRLTNVLVRLFVQPGSNAVHIVGSGFRPLSAFYDGGSRCKQVSAR